MRTFPTVPPNADNRTLMERVNGAIAGKLNAVTTVTLTANATTTTLIDKRITGDSFIGLFPLTANAAAATTSLYESAQDAGTATLTHNNTAATDRTFRVLIIG